jgi:hypothetical protein
MKLVIYTSKENADSLVTPGKGGWEYEVGTDLTESTEQVEESFDM